MAFLIAFIPLLVVIVVVIIPAMLLVRWWVKKSQQKAKKWGYATLGDYLRAPPQTDQEKQEAVDLALKGLVICVLGFLFPPLLLIGVFPLFFGVRKMAYSSMGLGLLDDADV